MRIFLAVPVPPALAASLSDAQRRLSGILPAVRWADIESFHITLKFLGEVEPSQLDDIESVAKKAVQDLAPFSITVKGVGSFPSRRAAQVIWTSVDEGSFPLKILAEKLGKGLAELGFAQEKRSYRPHITLGRLKSSAPLTVPQGKIEPDLSFGGFEAKELNIMQSELRPQGPLYTILRRCPFKEC